MKRYLLIVVVFIVSFLIQEHFNLLIKKEFISTLLTVFSIIFGFYVTSFAVFATSKYLAKLYQLENKSDNRKTLLDDLLGEFTFATYFLLASIIYMILAYIFIENKYSFPVIYFIWGFIFMNVFYSFETISIFIKITRQSAKN